MEKGKGIRKKIFGRRLTKGLVALSLIIIVSIVSYVFYSSIFLKPSNDNVTETLPRKAAIVDELSLTNPNEATRARQNSTEILEEAGFTVDYYGGDNVTVELYRNLPSQGHGLIIFRVHSGWSNQKHCLFLFTSEEYDKWKYQDLQLDDQLVRVGVSEELALWFGITPKFVEKSMNGRFQNTIILMMTCTGFIDPKMAEAFVEKGASVYISWTELVDADHNDDATAALLDKLVVKKQTIEQAVNETMKEVGPDPTYGGELRYHPPEKGGYAIPTVQVRIASLVHTTFISTTQPRRRP